MAPGLGYLKILQHDGARPDRPAVLPDLNPERLTTCIDAGKATKKLVVTQVRRLPMRAKPLPAT